jgi:hypothetical protein
LAGAHLQINKGTEEAWRRFICSDHIPVTVQGECRVRLVLERQPKPVAVASAGLARRGERIATVAHEPANSNSPNIGSLLIEVTPVAPGSTSTKIGYMKPSRPLLMSVSAQSKSCFRGLSSPASG